jgi:DNA-binding beta-propeller fold protein YncE
VIDGATNAVVATIPVKGISTYPPAFDAGNGALYFPNIDLGGISIVSGGTNTLVGNLTLGEPSDTILGGPTYDPRNGEVYAPAIIVGESTGTVFVIGNGSASSAPVPTGLPWVVFGAGLGGAAVAAGLVVTYRRRQAPTKGEPR